jgi:hypothetical protein
MKTGGQFDMERAIDTIDRIVNDVALGWMKMNKAAIRTEFLRVFAGMEAELILHLLGKWDGDFARFYLNAGEEVRRKIFDYYHIPLEVDKFSDVNMALIDGVAKFDVFPYESYIVHLFYLMAYNNSLELLRTIAPGSFQVIKEKRIKLYGNGLNWSRAWTVCTSTDREHIVEYIFKNSL